ncbi:hypothetical protein KJ763_01310 [Patescibacteria group bacterium]|nr:hypothetical protein [Patescibacteria group bacterium]
MTLLINNIIIISGSIMAVSFIAMSVVIGRHLKEIRMIVDNESISNFDFSRSLAKSFYCSTKNFLVCFWRNYFVPLCLRITEIIIVALEKMTKKIQFCLVRFSNYIKGRRKISNLKNNSEYWDDMIDFKNNLNENGDNNEKENKTE